MKKLMILIVSMVVLSVNMQAQTTTATNYKDFTVSAAEDTVTGADTANLTMEITSPVDFGATFIVKSTKTSGTVAGAGITMWGRNKTTDSWTALTASNYYTAMQATDTLTNASAQYVYIVHHTRFRYLKFENKVTTGTVATTARMYYWNLPTTEMK